MASYTPNNNLKKPAGTDYVLVGDLNGNMDILDAAVGNLGQLGTPAKNSLVAAINDAAEMGGGHPPYYDEDTSTWWEWDQATLQYVDTDRPASASVDVDSTATLAPGSDASVENVGTSLDVRLKFGIPRGDPGEAATVTAGDTSTLAPGVSATVTERGTAQNRILDFGVPQGETGAGLHILGQYDSLDDLEAAHPTGSPGDMYMVGAEIPRDAYQWEESAGVWVNEGPLAGGGGTVKSVNNLSPNETGNITLTAANIPMDASEEPASVLEEISSLQTSLASGADGEYLTTEDDGEGGREWVYKQPDAAEIAYENESIPGVEDAGAALDAIVDMRGAPDGLAQLDTEGRVPAEQMNSQLFDAAAQANVDINTTPAVGYGPLDWKNAVLINGATNAYDSLPLQYARANGIVYLRGYVKRNTTAGALSTANELKK
jgi:hypothetical protein